MHRHLFQRTRLRCFSTENDFKAAKEAINAIQTHPTEEAAHRHATQGLHRVQSGHIQEGISLFQKGLDILSSSPTTPTAPTAETFTASPTARHLHNCLGLAKQTQSEFLAAETSLQNAFELCNDPALLGLGDDQFIDRTGVLMDLAANLMHQGSFGQADKLLRRSHYTATRAYSPNQELIATVLGNQAELEWLRGDVERAQELMTRARDALSTVSSSTMPCDPMDGSSFDLLVHYSLAKYALNNQNDDDGWSNATRLSDDLRAQLHEKTTADTKKPGEKHKYQLLRGRLYTHRGLLSSLLGDFDQAKILHDKAYTTFSDMYQEENGMTTAVDVAVAMNNKGLYAASRQEAKELYALAMHCLKRVPDQRMYQAVNSNLNTVTSSSSSSPPPPTAMQSSAMVVPVSLPNQNAASTASPTAPPMLQLHHFVPLTGLAISMAPHRRPVQNGSVAGGTVRGATTTSSRGGRSVQHYSTVPGGSLTSLAFPTPAHRFFSTPSTGRSTSLRAQERNKRLRGFTQEETDRTEANKKETQQKKQVVFQNQQLKRKLQQNNGEEDSLPPKYARLKYLPRVRPSSELLGASFWKHSERIAVKKHKKKATPHKADRAISANINIMLNRMSTHDAMEGIDHMSHELKKCMVADVQNIPHSDAFHPYEQALIDLTLGSKFPKQTTISGDGLGLLKYNTIVKKAKNITYKKIDEVTNGLRRRSNKGVVRRKINTNPKKNRLLKKGVGKQQQQEQRLREEQGHDNKEKGGVGWNLLRDGQDQLEHIINGGSSSKTGNEWKDLGAMIGQLRSIPSVHLPPRPSLTGSSSLTSFSISDFMGPPIVLVGAPNVGKSSLVSVLSSKSPEVNHYPFTTRGILIGNMEWGNACDRATDEAEKIDWDDQGGEDQGACTTGNNDQLLQCQIMDTPGLLHRTIEERNNIELLTLASLSYLPSCIVMYVLDLTESATTSHEEQILLRTSMHEAFSTQANVRGWIDVCGKSDLPMNNEYQHVIDQSVQVSCLEEASDGGGERGGNINALSGALHAMHQTIQNDKNPWWKEEEQ